MNDYQYRVVPVRFCRMCGHTEVSHEKEGCSPIVGWGIPKPTCAKDCKEFVLDNLKYLEDKFMLGKV